MSSGNIGQRASRTLDFDSKDGGKILNDKQAKALRGKELSKRLEAGYSIGLNQTEIYSINRM